MERCCINKGKSEIEYGVRKMLDRYYYIREKINNSSAYSTAETEERLKLMREQDFLEGHLKMMGIQSFEVKSQWIDFNIQ